LLSQGELRKEYTGGGEGEGEGIGGVRELQY